MIKMKESITAATLAQRGFNKAAMINPYVAAVAGVIALITALDTLIKRSKDVQGNIDSLNNSIEGMGKQNAVDELIARYEVLNKNTKKSTEENEEFKKIIIQLGKEFPGFIEKYDQYGNAIVWTTEKLNEQNEALRKNRKVLLEGDVKDAEEKKAKLLARQAQIQKQLDAGKLSGVDKLKKSIYVSEESALKKLRQESVEANAKLAELQETINKGKDAVSGIQSIDAAKLLAPYKD